MRSDFSLNTHSVVASVYHLLIIVCGAPACYHRCASTVDIFAATSVIYSNFTVVVVQAAYLPIFHQATTTTRGGGDGTYLSLFWEGTAGN